MIIAAWQVLLKERVGETADEAALVVLHHLIEVVLEKFQFEVCQIKAAVIVCSELISRIDDDLVRVSIRHESVRHCPSNLEDLLVRGNQFVELERRVRADRQMAYLALSRVNVDAFVVRESATRVNHCDHLVLVNLSGSLLLQSELLSSVITDYFAFSWSDSRLVFFDFIWLYVLVLNVHTREKEGCTLLFSLVFAFSFNNSVSTVLLIDKRNGASFVSAVFLVRAQALLFGSTVLVAGTNIAFDTASIRVVHIGARGGLHVGRVLALATFDDLKLVHLDVIGPTRRHRLNL